MPARTPQLTDRNGQTPLALARARGYERDGADPGGGRGEVTVSSAKRATVGSGDPTAAGTRLAALTGAAKGGRK